MSYNSFIHINHHIEKFNLSLVHIHPNNNSLIDHNNDPTCVEITFEKSPVENKDELNLPNKLDMIYLLTGIKTLHYSNKRQRL